MKQLQFGTSDETVSSVILGCMRLNGAENPQQVIETAYDHGITFFDHADIYGGGDCETIFGKALKESTIRREDIFIQTKCGIRQGFLTFKSTYFRSGRREFTAFRCRFSRCIIVASSRYFSGTRRSS